MKDQVMDVILLAAMFLGIYLWDYRPYKEQRGRKVNLWYLALLLLSAVIIAAVTLLPELPKIADLFAPYFR